MWSPIPVLAAPPLIKLSNVSEKTEKKAKVSGLLPPRWETQMEFWVLNLGMTQFLQLQPFGGGNQQIDIL